MGGGFVFFTASIGALAAAMAVNNIVGIAVFVIALIVFGLMIHSIEERPVAADTAFCFGCWFIFFFCLVLWAGSGKDPVPQEIERLKLDLSVGENQIAKIRQVYANKRQNGKFQTDYEVALERFDKSGQLWRTWDYRFGMVGLTFLIALGGTFAFVSMASARAVGTVAGHAVGAARYARESGNFPRVAGGLASGVAAKVAARRIINGDFRGHEGPFWRGVFTRAAISTIIERMFRRR